MSQIVRGSISAWPVTDAEAPGRVLRPRGAENGRSCVLLIRLALFPCRHGSWREPVNPYYVNTGYALAPATSANDSEQQSMSSDADTMSLTDSSV